MNKVILALVLVGLACLVKADASSDEVTSFEDCLKEFEQAAQKIVVPAEFVEIKKDLAAGEPNVSPVDIFKAKSVYKVDDYLGEVSNLEVLREIAKQFRDECFERFQQLSCTPGDLFTMVNTDEEDSRAQVSSKVADDLNGYLLLALKLIGDDDQF